MSKTSIATALSLFACGVFMVGVIASLSSIIRYPAVERELAKAIRTAERLDGVERAFAELDAILAPFEGLAYEALQDPKTLANSAFGGDGVEEVRQHKEACDAGYAVNQIEINLKAVLLKKVLPFIRTAEALRPPIRLTSCTIHASDTQSGTGNVTLGFERIELEE
jgi:hypothetical protein